jgi:hypothetical protein
MLFMMLLCNDVSDPDDDYVQDFILEIYAKFQGF